MKRVWFCCVTIALILSFSLSAVAVERPENLTANDQVSPEPLSANGFYYRLNGNEAVLLGLVEPAETVVVPRELQGHKVTALAPFAFPLQEGVTAFETEDGHPVFSAADGVLYNKNKTEIIRYPAAKPSPEFSVPSSVTVIGETAFYDCTALTQIRLGEQIRTINDHAFSQSGIVDVTLPKSVKRLGNGWFKNCTALTRVGIPATVTSMASGTFSGCVSLTDVVLPSELTAIGEYAFEFCSSLTTLALPATVNSIGYSAFLGCTGLQEVSISAAVTFIDTYAFPETALQVAPDNKNYTSVDGVLFNKAQRILLSYPNSKTQTDYTLPETVTSIGEGAFEGNRSLTAVTLPKGLTAVGAYGFAFSALQSIVLPDRVTDLGEGAFCGCEQLNRATLSANLTEIPEDCFSACTALTHVGLSNGLQTIGDGAFDGCSALYGMAIPSTVTKLDNSGIGMVCSSDDQPPLAMKAFALYGTAGSTAEQYARKMGIPFEIKTPAEIERLNREGVPVIEWKEPVLADTTPKTEHTAAILPKEPSDPSFFSQYGVWLAVGGGALLSAGVTVVLLVRKKKKHGENDEEISHTTTEKESDTN